MLLTQDLQGVGNAAGHNAGIQDRALCGPDIDHGGLFKEEHADNAQGTGHQKLHTGHAHAVHILGPEVVDGHNVQGKEEGAAQPTYIYN